MATQVCYGTHLLFQHAQFPDFTVLLAQRVELFCFITAGANSISRFFHF